MGSWAETWLTPQVRCLLRSLVIQIWKVRIREQLTMPVPGTCQACPTTTMPGGGTYWHLAEYCDCSGRTCQGQCGTQAQPEALELSLSASASLCSCSTKQAGCRKTIDRQYLVYWDQRFFKYENKAGIERKKYLRSKKKCKISKFDFLKNSRLISFGFVCKAKFGNLGSMFSHMSSRWDCVWVHKGFYNGN